MVFITLCTQDRKSLFGEIIDGKFHASTFGNIAQAQWRDIAKRWPSIIVDEFIIMPNHIHGILQLNTKTAFEASLAGAQTKDNALTVGAVIGGYKSLVFKACLAHAKEHDQQLGTFWQRNYWEHVVRNEAELQNIREYIQNNPASWENDALYVGRDVL